MTWWFYIGTAPAWGDGCRHFFRTVHTQYQWRIAADRESAK